MYLKINFLPIIWARIIIVYYISNIIHVEYNATRNLDTISRQQIEVAIVDLTPKQAQNAEEFVEDDATQCG